MTWMPCACDRSPGTSGGDAERFATYDRAVRSSSVTRATRRLRSYFPLSASATETVSNLSDSGDPITLMRISSNTFRSSALSERSIRGFFLSTAAAGGTDTPEPPLSPNPAPSGACACADAKPQLCDRDSCSASSLASKTCLRLTSGMRSPSVCAATATSSASSASISPMCTSVSSAAWASSSSEACAVSGVSGVSGGAAGPLLLASSVPSAGTSLFLRLSMYDCRPRGGFPHARAAFIILAIHAFFSNSDSAMSSYIRGPFSEVLTRKNAQRSLSDSTFRTRTSYRGIGSISTMRWTSFLYVRSTRSLKRIAWTVAFLFFVCGHADSVSWPSCRTSRGTPMMSRL
eukprot:Opistho-2@79169